MKSIEQLKKDEARKVNAIKINEGSIAKTNREFQSVNKMIEDTKNAINDITRYINKEGLSEAEIIEAAKKFATFESRQNTLFGRKDRITKKLQHYLKERSRLQGELNQISQELKKALVISQSIQA